MNASLRPPPFNKPRGYFQTSEASKVFDEIDLISEDLALHPTGESLFGVKWRTLVAKKVGNSQREALAEYGKQYKAMQEDMNSIFIILTLEDMPDSIPEHYIMALGVLDY